jgi:hypothetical protein
MRDIPIIGACAHCIELATELAECVKALERATGLNQKAMRELRRLSDSAGDPQGEDTEGG